MIRIALQLILALLNVLPKAFEQARAWKAERAIAAEKEAKDKRNREALK